MKKRIVVLTVVCGIIVPFGGWLAEAADYEILDEPRADEDQPMASSEDPRAICRIHGAADPYWQEAVNRQLSVLPAAMLDAFIAAGWTLYVTDMNIDREIFGGAFGSVMGCTLYETREIFIEDRENAVTESTVHEFGHFMDDYLGGEGFLSDTLEYRKIYDRELDSFMNGFGTTCYMDPKELAAEGLFQYYLDPAKLETCAPGLYVFVEECVETFSDMVYPEADSCNPDKDVL